VDGHRNLFGDERFHQLKNADVASCLGAMQRFAVNIARADKTKQGLFAKLFWGMIKGARFKEATVELEKIHALIGTLCLSTIRDQIGDDTISEWSNLCEDLGKRYDFAIEVQDYFGALETLSSSRKLEELDADLMDLDEQMASVCMQLWQKWLKLMPTRLNSRERELLGEYTAIVQLLAEAEQAGQQAARNVFSKYQTLLPRVMDVFSCWAVTSLSARGGRIPFEPGFFDIVVIDEASQCDIASALPLLYRAKQAVIIGDPNQLKHISPIPRAKDTQLLDRYELLNTHAKYAYSVNSLYDLAAGMVTPGALVNLRDHHRSHADIIGFSNRHFYDESLRVATRYDRLNMLSSDEPSVRWHHVAGEAVRPRSGSAQNTLEAEKVVSIISDLLLNRGYTGSIGVVSPFRAQVNYIDRLLNASSELSSRLAGADVLVDTVHKFQGDERDVMIFSPVVARGMQQSSLKFLKGNGNLFNVAITRARSALIVAGDMNAARDSQIDYLSAFASYAQSLNTQRDQSREDAQMVGLGADYPRVSNPEQVSDWERWFYKKLYAAGLRPIPQYSEEKYRLDFALFDGERKLDIEVDGERYHREWTGELCQRDRIRNQRLMELDWDVMRFWVYEIRDNTDACIGRIRNWINQK
jgi:very-short-patch-repair endonuclease